MIVKGTIEIDSNNKSVTIKLENGSYCLDHFTHGVKRFLDEEIDCLKRQERKELHEQIMKLCGLDKIID